MNKEEIKYLNDFYEELPDELKDDPLTRVMLAVGFCSKDLEK